MSIAVYFAPKSLDESRYESLLARMAASVPASRSLHAAFGRGENVHIFEIWESRDAFEAYGSELRRVLADLELDLGPATISTVQAVVT